MTIISFLGWRHSSSSAMDFEVVTAEDGEEGYAVFHDHMSRIDIVITDLMLPKLSGTELCKRIKKERPEVPVVLSHGAEGAKQLAF